ncbi:DUF4011 domain-containing anti-phage protein Hhe [Moraxella marmotae]|uniref:DUF4011 domain-containing anti-phage protein Hhe n=1 Tax=Moraxella marmotae TaxID=3344520 RepID=UPI0035F39275
MENFTSSEFAFNSLENVRKRLLDLTTRNTLLSYRATKGKSLPIFGISPNQIFEILNENGSLPLEPVPMPSAKQLSEQNFEDNNYSSENLPPSEEWAKYLGLNLSPELPQQSTELSKLQTNLYMPELEKRLKYIRTQANSAVEETGANILYLALGFLEWTEANNSRKRLAPLFTLPILIEDEIKNGNRIYSIKLKEEGIFSNVTLREKLSHDFDLVLPLITEEQSPEDYFRDVECAIKKSQPNWRVKRQAFVALLNFSKQAMYEDLNPENWPKHALLEEHPLIKQLFATSGKENSKNMSYSEEYPLDDIPDMHTKFPLIYDADSSQHSALIDAVKGKNLVIEGPPGTGKSQTITNLIAACINSGKSVLFVAEKMAALNVVKDRLDKAGLGDFCLEIHSHKTDKKKILADLVNSYQTRGNYQDIEQLQNNIAYYERYKIALQDYVHLINQPWKQTGLTIHEILNRAVRFRNELPLSPSVITLNLSDDIELNANKINELTTNGGMLRYIFDQVCQQSPNGYISGHYWHGVGKSSFLDYEEKQLVSLLENWNQQLEVLNQRCQSWQETFGIPLDFTFTETNLKTFQTHLYSLPELQGNEILNANLVNPDNLQALSSFIRAYTDAHTKLDSIQTVFKIETLDKPEQHTEISQLIEKISKICGNSQISIEELATAFQTAQKLQQTISLLENELVTIRKGTPTNLHHLFDNNLESFRELSVFVGLIDQLPSNLWQHRDEIFDNPDLDSVLAQLVGVLKTLTPLHQKLSPIFHLGSLPDAADLQDHLSVLENGGFFKIFSSTWRTAKKALVSLACQTKPNIKNLQAALPDLINYKQQLDEADRINQLTPVLEQRYQGAETPIEQIQALRAWYQAVRREYGSGFGDRVRTGTTLLALDRNLAYTIRDTYHQILHRLNENILNNLKYASEIFDKIPQLINPKINLADTDAPLQKLISNLENVLKILGQHVANGKNTVVDITKANQILNEVVEIHQSLHQCNLEFVPESWSLPLTFSQFDADTVQSVQNTLSVLNVANQYTAIFSALRVSPSRETYTKLLSFGKDFNMAVQQAETAEDQFMSVGEVDKAVWIGEKSLVGLLEKNLTAIMNPLWLSTWASYVKTRQQLSSTGLEKIIGCLESQQIQPEQLGQAIGLAIYHQLSEDILATNAKIRDFNGLSHQAIINKFKKCDGELMTWQRKKIAFNASRKEVPPGVGIGRVSNYTEYSLIRREHEKKQRHIAIRSLLDRAPEAIKALKPCFMMSPMSVAQYLKPGSFQFDMIIMDEASQILPEDAIGALARGAHDGSCSIIVGDPKQLPPTSFFQSSVNNEDDEENIVAVEQSESILESVSSHSSFRTRRLRWHYRSRHESLIAFSNKHFYDSDLVLFPSPMEETDDLGIRFTKVKNGCFENSRNVEEACKVVSKALEILQDSPHESIGMVAMNSAQRDEIQMQFDQQLQENPHLQTLVDKKAKTDPVFIKNLENVQGDERDVILISMTYGPETIGGRVYQRFGPINSANGWRRLNVLFTRAKKRMHIFSSMSSSDILAVETSSKGVKALKAFLEYCERGHLYQTVATGKAPDSDFEIAVIKALEKHGYQCEPQVGVNGFFLDVAVRNPRKPNQFLIGVECDGATYHSAKSARDRDRLRQEILEGLGWEIHRIWSTEWFRNPEAALMPILKRLKELEQKFTFQEVDNVDASRPETISNSVESMENTESEGEESHIYQDTEKPEVSSIDDSKSLKEKLQDLARKIEAEHPDVPSERRILRPDMIEVLVHQRPTSREEFLSLIPKYLRENIHASEGDYLNEIFKLIMED